jgi:hypothetical protein
MWQLLGLGGSNVVDGVGNGNAVEAVLVVVVCRIASGTVWVLFGSAPEAISSKLE